MDPSGTYVRCDAKAIGSGAEGAQGSLGDIYHADISLKEATKHALTILKQVETFYNSKVEIHLLLEHVKNLLFTDFHLGLSQRNNPHMIIISYPCPTNDMNGINLLLIKLSRLWKRS